MLAGFRLACGYLGMGGRKAYSRQFELDANHQPARSSLLGANCETLTEEESQRPGDCHPRVHSASQDGVDIKQQGRQCSMPLTALPAPDSNWLTPSGDNQHAAARSRHV